MEKGGSIVTLTSQTKLRENKKRRNFWRFHLHCCHGKCIQFITFVGVPVMCLYIYIIYILILNAYICGWALSFFEMLYICRCCDESVKSKFSVVKTVFPREFKSSIDYGFFLKNKNRQLCITLYSNYGTTPYKRKTGKEYNPP